MKKKAAEQPSKLKEDHCPTPIFHLQLPLPTPIYFMTHITGDDRVIRVTLTPEPEPAAAAAAAAAAARKP